jgi:hypothetical protein
MTKNNHKASNINKNSSSTDDNSRHNRRQYLSVELSDKERIYFERLASVMSKIQVENDKKLLPNNTLASLGKMALGMLTHVFLSQVLVQSELAKTLPDKEALNEFIAFRRDYMNFPVDKQIADLKRVGVVK